MSARCKAGSASSFQTKGADPATRQAGIIPCGRGRESFAAIGGRKEGGVAKRFPSFLRCPSSLRPTHSPPVCLPFCLPSFIDGLCLRLHDADSKSQWNRRSHAYPTPVNAGTKEREWHVALLPAPDGRERRWSDITSTLRRVTTLGT